MENISDMFDNIKLRPCPFCGGANLVVGTDYEIDGDCDPFCELDDDFYAVRCDARNGGCGATGGFYDTKIESITNWNRREGV